MTSRWGLPEWGEPDPDESDDPFLDSSPWCAACPTIGVPPFRPAVPQQDEAISVPDDLCGLHNPRATEGVCVICGRRPVWMEIHRGGGFGCCRAWYAAAWGEDEADRLERVRNLGS